MAQTVKKKTTKSSGKTSSSGSTKKKSSTHTSEEHYDSAMKKEVVLLFILAASILLALSNFGICGAFGKVLSNIMFGIFGISAYIFPIYLFLSAAFLISNKYNKKAMIKFISSIWMYLFICMLLEMIATPFDKKTALLSYYAVASKSHKGGGLIGGLLSKIFRPLLGTVGSYIITIIALIVGIVLITEKSFINGVKKGSSQVYKAAKEDAARMKAANKSRLEDREAQQYRKKNIPKEQTSVKKVRGISFTELEEPEKKENDIREITYDYQESDELELAVPVGRVKEAVPKPKKKKSQFIDFTESPIMPKIEEPEPFAIDPTAAVFSPEFAKSSMPEEVLDYTVDISEVIEEPQKEVSLRELKRRAEKKIEPEIKKATMNVKKPKLSEEDELQKRTKKLEGKEISEEIKSENLAETQMPIIEEIEEAQEDRITAENRDEIRENEREEIEEEFEPEVYELPPLALLKRGQGSDINHDKSSEIQKTAEKLQTTLQNFGVGVTITNVSCGPSVTRYELQPEQGVKVSKIVGLADDIKLNLAAADIRIEAPIPGKAAVGIEVPNKENMTVMLRDLLESKEFQNSSSRLTFAVGKDIGGQTIVADIAKMPHLLIAGATGSGKSVCINTLIMSILYKAMPDEVKLIMIDPKVVELSIYNGIPHLMIPVVTDPKKASAALNWAVAEMSERYKKFADINVRDLKGYNDKIESIKEIEEEGKPKKLPQIVIIIDELADLMMVAPGEVEESICRLAQLARAAGIHLVIATQRPSVNVITGLIKANVPSRIAFSVSSGVDSRTIIDMNGAEKLLGKGDMLFYPSGYQKPVRVQGAFISDKEVGAVVDFLSEQAVPNYNEAITSKITEGSVLEAAGQDNKRDDYFVDAGRFIIEKEKASIGMLQRMFKIGFNRAARIMDQLAEAGIVGPEEGTKPRKILMNMEEFEQWIEEYLS